MGKIRTWFARKNEGGHRKFVGGIKRRWLINSVGISALVLLLAAILVSVIVSNYYYNSVHTTLAQLAQSTSRYFNRFLSSSYSEYYSSAKTYAEEYAEKNLVEIQFINLNGRVNISTAGMISGVTPGTSDISDALSTGKTADYVGRDRLTGERIMAVSCPLVYGQGRTIGVVRCITSLRIVDAKVLSVTLVCFAAAAGIMCLVIFSNLFFIRSIVKPVAEITAIASKISQGSYGAQIEKGFDDEIGELRDTINNMSLELSNAERMKNEFISSVSHELRTPLTAISGWGETILYTEDPEEIKRGVAVMLRETRRLSSLVEELLEFTALEGGRLKMHMEPMDPAAELEDVVYLYADTLSKRGIKLAYSSDDEIPIITGDAERLRQVFYNIIDNAAKHGGDGGRIDVAIRFDGEFVLVSVRDYGAGIPEEDLPHVKKKFYRGSSQERGNGIGLAVASEIVDRHGGELIIENAEGGGAVVTIKLPLTLG